MREEEVIAEKVLIGNYAVRVGESRDQKRRGGVNRQGKGFVGY